jgi:hypothetical protein
MKKIVFIILLALGFTVNSCADLEITPDGRMSLEDVFVNEIQTEAYLNTVYSSMPSYYNTYQNYSFLAGLTDEAQDAEVGNVMEFTAAWITGSLTPSYNPFAMAGPSGSGQDRYLTFWAGIRDANVFLQYAPTVTFADADRKDRLIDEARLLRVFYYFELIKQFGPMPIVIEPFDPAFDYTTLTRPSFQDCINFIDAECRDIIQRNKLPLRITLETERGRLSLPVAHMLRSESLLYNASPLWNSSDDLTKWTAAATASREAITALTSGNTYELYDDYEMYFLNTSDLTTVPRDKETIFGIRTQGVPGTVISIPSKSGTWKLGATPSQELVDVYDMKATGEPAILGYADADHLTPIINTASGYDEQNPYVGRDPRFYATVWYNEAEYDNINGKIHIVETFIGGADQLIKSPPNRTNTHTGYYLRKFVDPILTVNQWSAPEFKKYRLAELFLNFAEAENEANGPTPEVYDAIKKVRNRVGMPDLPGGLNKDNMRFRIRRERQVELVWEEHRFWDVRRWKILSETDKLVTGMEIRGSSGKVNIPNAGFENGATGWNLIQADVVSINNHTSAHVVEISDPNGGHVWTTVSGLEPNTKYQLSAFISAYTGDWGLLGVRNYGGAEDNVAATIGQARRYSIEFTTGSTNTTADIFSWWSAGATGIVDDFEMKKVDAGGGPVGFTYTRFVTERRNAWQDKYMIFPIPISDASIIPDFQLHQNPGW